MKKALFGKGGNGLFGRVFGSRKCRLASRFSLWSKSFVLILLVSLFGFVVVQGSNTGTSAYLALKGASATYIGVVAMLFTIAAAVARLASGAAIDACSRHAVLMSGAIVLLAGILGVVLAPRVDLMWLFRVLQGIGFASVTTAAATMAADVVPEERLGEGISYYGLAQAVSMTIGPGLALYLVFCDPPEIMYTVLLICSFALLFCSLFCTYEKYPERLPKGASYRISCQEGHAKSGFALEPECLRGAVPAFLLAPVFAFGIFYLSAYAQSTSINYGGAFYAAASVTMILVRLALGSWIDSRSPIEVYRLPIFGGLLAFALLFAVEYCHELFLLAGLFYGLCMGVANPLHQTVCVKCAPKEKYGIANGMYLLGVDLGVGLGSAVWGVFIDCFGFRFTIACVMVAAVVSYGVAALVYPKPEKD